MDVPLDDWISKTKKKTFTPTRSQQGALQGGRSKSNAAKKKDPLSMPLETFVAASSGGKGIRGKQTPLSSNAKLNRKVIKGSFSSYKKPNNMAKRPVITPPVILNTTRTRGAASQAMKNFNYVNMPSRLRKRLDRPDLGRLSRTLRPSTYIENNSRDSSSNRYFTSASRLGTAKNLQPAIDNAFKTRRNNHNSNSEHHASTGMTEAKTIIMSPSSKGLTKSMKLTQEERALASKIKIMAQLDKVPSPSQAQKIFAQSIIKSYAAEEPGQISTLSERFI